MVIYIDGIEQVGLGGYAGHLYNALSVTNGLLVDLGSNRDIDKTIVAYKAFEDKDCTTLEKLVSSNLGKIDSAKVIPINTAHYFREIKDLLYNLNL